MPMGVSCGDGILGGGRTEVERRSCNPFDDQLGPATFGAKPSIARTGGGYLCVGLCCRAEQLKAKRQRRGTPSIGQEAKVSDAHENLGEQMQQDATQALLDRYSPEFLIVTVVGIATT